MIFIKRNDTVKVLAGKDKGKSGKVLKVYPGVNRVVVQGINFSKKHVRRKKQDEQGGIMQREAPIAISNLAVICKGCSRPTRIGVDVLADGTKTRYCKKCRESL